MRHVEHVKAICFMEERGIGADFTFDGNDMQATHMIAYDGKEPIGTVRGRWFRDFAKYERTSFRAAWRNPRVLKRCAEFTFEHVARKGFDTPPDILMRVEGYWDVPSQTQVYL